jgi:hypothetical protein
MAKKKEELFPFGFNVRPKPRKAKSAGKSKKKPRGSRGGAFGS